MATIRRTYANIRKDSFRYVRWGNVETPRPSNGYKSVNPYDCQIARASGDTAPNSSVLIYPCWPTNIVDQLDTTYRLRALEIAARKFRRKCQGDTAGLGINIVQWKQSMNMITNRVKTLSRFAHLIPVTAPILFYGNLIRRRRALKILAHSLNYPANSHRVRVLERRSNAEWRRRIRTPGDLWLEFWFGWSPLINDIYQGAKILSDPNTPDRKVTTSHTFNYRYHYRTGSMATSGDIRNAAGRGSLGIFALVKVTNPNSYLANKMGLANPALIALDAIPFSWVANWFVNLNEFCESLNWDAGLSFSKGGYGYSWKVSFVGYHRNQNWPEPKLRSGKATLERRQRSAGLPSAVHDVKLRLRVPMGSASRAATATALLLQKISKFSKPFNFR